MKAVCSFATLMRHTGKLGDARKSGDADAIKLAEARHSTYLKACLASDEMAVGCTNALKG